MPKSKYKESYQTASLRRGDQLVAVRKGSTEVIPAEKIAEEKSKDESQVEFISKNTLKIRKYNAKEGYTDKRNYKKFYFNDREYFGGKKIDLDDPETLPPDTTKADLEFMTYGAFANKKRLHTKIWIDTKTFEILGEEEKINLQKPETFPDDYTLAKMRLVTRSHLKQLKYQAKEISVFFDGETYREATFEEIEADLNNDDNNKKLLKMPMKKFKSLMQDPHKHMVWGNIKNKKDFYEENQINLAYPDETLKENGLKPNDVQFMSLREFKNLGKKVKNIRVLAGTATQVDKNKKVKQLRKVYGADAKFELINGYTLQNRKTKTRTIWVVKEPGGNYRKALKEEPGAEEIPAHKFYENNEKMDLMVIDIKTKKPIEGADPNNLLEGQEALSRKSYQARERRRSKLVVIDVRTDDIIEDADPTALTEHQKVVQLETAKARQRKHKLAATESEESTEPRPAKKRRLVTESEKAEFKSVAEASASQKTATMMDVDESKSEQAEEQKQDQPTDSEIKARSLGFAFGLSYAKQSEKLPRKNSKCFAAERLNLGPAFDRYYEQCIVGFNLMQKALLDGKEQAIRDISRKNPMLKIADDFCQRKRHEVGVCFEDWYNIYIKEYKTSAAQHAISCAKKQATKEAHRFLTQPDEKNPSFDLARQEFGEFFTEYLKAYQSEFPIASAQVQKQIAVKKLRDAKDIQQDKNSIQSICANYKVKFGWQDQDDCVFMAHPKAKNDFLDIFGVVYKQGSTQFKTLEEKLVIVRSPVINQRGVKSVEDIYFPIGTPMKDRILIEYTGENFTKDYKPEIDSHFYKVEFPTGVNFVDATRCGNAARFINYAEEKVANCEYLEIEDHIVVVVKEGMRIRAGIDEFTCHYKDSPGNIKVINAAQSAAAPSTAERYQQPVSMTQLMTKRREREGLNKTAAVAMDVTADSTPAKQPSQSSSAASR